LGGNWGPIPINTKQTWTYLEQALPRKECCVMVVEQDGDFVGVLIATARQYAFNVAFHAQIEVFYVVPARRRTAVAMQLMGAFRRWATNRDVVEIWLMDNFNAPSEYNRKLFARMGIPAIGALHSKWVERS